MPDFFFPISGIHSVPERVHLSAWLVQEAKNLGWKNIQSSSISRGPNKPVYFQAQPCDWSSEKDWQMR